MSSFWTSQTRLAIQGVLFLAVLVPSTTAECYWPNGGVAGNYASCPSSKVCCLKGEACLSNGLCYAARYNVAYRGACTDTSWPIADCPRACYTTIPDQWANLLTCSGTPRGNFTCSTAVDGKTACGQNVETWKWEGDSGVNVTVAQNGVSSTSSTDISPGSTTNSTSSSTNSPSTTPPSPSSTHTSVSTTDKNGSYKSVVSLGAGLGVGLGVPLILAVSVLVFYCLRVRRRSKATDNTQNATWNLIGNPSSQVTRTKEAFYGPSELGAERYPSELHA